MGYLNETVKAAAEGRSVRAAILVFFDFADAPMRVWTGHGRIKAGGYTWDGLGQLASIEGLEQIRQLSAPNVTLRLSGVDPSLLVKVRQQTALVKNRDVSIYMQFFDDKVQPLDQPVSLWMGFMDVMSYAAQGPSERTISVSAEGYWSGKRRPAYSRYTDRDQQARWPGDLGCSQCSEAVTKTLRWPYIPPPES